MFVVILAWVFFRSADIASGCRYIGQMFGIGANGFADGVFAENIRTTYLVLILSFIGITPLLKKVFNHLEKKNYTAIEWIWLLAVFSVSVLEIVSASYNPFIYFNF